MRLPVSVTGVSESVLRGAGVATPEILMSKVVNLKGE
jgi:hypothetical protein